MTTLIRNAVTACCVLLSVMPAFAQICGRFGRAYERTPGPGCHGA
jgi:hypothetical protein